MDPVVGRVARRSNHWLGRAAPDAVADVGLALGWPGALDEDLAVGVGEDDAALVPRGWFARPMFADLDPDPVQVDVAVGLDLHLAAALAALREDPGRCGDLSVGRLWSRRLGDGCGARTPEAWPGRVVLMGPSRSNSSAGAEINATRADSPELLGSRS